MDNKSATENHKLRQERFTSSQLSRRRNGGQNVCTHFQQKIKKRTSRLLKQEAYGKKSLTWAEFISLYHTSLFKYMIQKVLLSIILRTFRSGLLSVCALGWQCLRRIKAQTNHLHASTKLIQHAAFMTEKPLTLSDRALQR